MNKAFLTVKELSEYLSVKSKTIYSWIGKGVIPFYRMEGTVRFRKQDIDLWLEKKHHQVKGFMKRTVRAVEEEYGV